MFDPGRARRQRVDVDVDVDGGLRAAVSRFALALVVLGAVVALRLTYVFC